MIHSPSELEDLRSEGVPEIVRLNFKALHDVIKAHGEAIKSVEKAAAGYRGQPLWHGASLVFTGADARPAVAEHLASGVWPGCEPSAELLDFFHYVFVAKDARPTVQMLLQVRRPAGKVGDHSRFDGREGCRGLL